MNHPICGAAVPSPSHPVARPRRLRYNPLVRELVRETELSPRDLILPLFVRPGKGVRQEIGSMPGNYQLSPDTLVDEVGAARDLGVTAFILFGIPEYKDATGSSALQDEGIVQKALRALRKAHGSNVLLITDECFCEYTDHGHCGILCDRGGILDVDNDATLPILAQQCVSHARAGADVIAPSGMMDGMVRAIREGLDTAGCTDIPILSYAAKYASGFYGPFRAGDAEVAARHLATATPTRWTRPTATRSAMKEVAIDLAEAASADIIMVKPALSYLDIIRRVKERFRVPVAAYNVSGEFAMVKAAAANGWIDERRVTLEILTSIRRAGADMILTYHARDAAKWLK